MNLRIASDLHLEFFPKGEDIDYSMFVKPNEDSKKKDILLLAGDICTWTRKDHLFKFLDFCSKNFYQTCYIPGNHEYFGSYFEDVIISDIDSRYENVISCEDELFYVGDIMIIGSTLWTDYNQGNPNAMIEARRFMNDYQTIRSKKTNKLFSPEESTRTNKMSRGFIKNALKNVDNSINCVVVMTHHSPSILSTDERFKGDSMNFAFSNTGLEEELLLTDDPDVRKPNIWIHGHMHNSSDYFIGQTLIICNPFGYWNGFKNENRDFSNTFLIEII